MTVSADPQIGSVILGYHIEELIGRGGMGVVYKAYDPRLKRNVALKLIAPGHSRHARFRERFLAETELAASLEHPNVVPIHDAGEVDGQLYIAMRYLAGGDLRALARSGLEPERALTLLVQVADALDAAHEAGLLHRDVKPGNVLLDRRDHCYLADFGLTQQTSSQSGSTARGAIVGTVDYVAPEVVEGRAFGARADLYSFACLAFECLSGRPPFHRDSEFAILWAHVNEPPPRLSERRGELPTALDEVFARALAKAPERRYGSAGELVDAVRAALPEPPPRKRRRWLVAALAVAAAAAAIVLSLVLTSGRNGASTRPTTAIRTDSLQRIDPQTGKLVATLKMPERIKGLVAGGGSVWAHGDQAKTILRIDPRRNAVVQEIPIPQVDALAFGAGALWALNARDGIVVELDPATGADLANIPLPRGSAGFYPGMTAAGSGVWLFWATRTRNAVVVDPVRLSARPVQLGPKAVQLVYGMAAVGEHALWLATPDPADPTRAVVQEIDPRRSLSNAAVVRLGDQYYGWVVADPAGAWYGGQAASEVLRVDSSRKRVDKRVQLPSQIPGGPAIALGERGLWVGNSNGVSHIDPRTGKILGTTPVGATPDMVAAGEGGVWVAVHPGAL